LGSATDQLIFWSARLIFQIAWSGQFLARSFGQFLVRLVFGQMVSFWLVFGQLLVCWSVSGLLVSFLSVGQFLVSFFKKMNKGPKIDQLTKN
jgi:hypothetical protein